MVLGRCFVVVFCSRSRDHWRILHHLEAPSEFRVKQLFVIGRILMYGSFVTKYKYLKWWVQKFDFHFLNFALLKLFPFHWMLVLINKHQNLKWPLLLSCLLSDRWQKRQKSIKWKFTYSFIKCKSTKATAINIYII